MKKEQLFIQKSVLILSLIYVTMVLVLCFYMIATGNAHNILIPFDKIVIPSVHFLVFIGSIVILFKYDYRLQFAMFQIENLLCILTNFQSLGIFFFYASCFIVYINNYSKQRTKIILKICFGIHIAAILYTMLVDWATALIYLFASIFVLLCFLWFYETLQAKFSCFVPSSVTKNELFNKIQPGSKIYLSDFGLTERQINFVYDFINSQMNYKDISEKYYVSLSTVKKEFTDVFKIFSVTKLEELHILLLQYVVNK